MTSTDNADAVPIHEREKIVSSILLLSGHHFFWFTPKVSKPEELDRTRSNLRKKDLPLDPHGVVLFALTIIKMVQNAREVYQDMCVAGKQPLMLSIKLCSSISRRTPLN